MHIIITYCFSSKSQTHFCVCMCVCLWGYLATLLLLRNLSRDYQNHCWDYRSHGHSCNPLHISNSAGRPSAWSATIYLASPFPSQPVEMHQWYTFSQKVRSSSSTVLAIIIFYMTDAAGFYNLFSGFRVLRIVHILSLTYLQSSFSTSCSNESPFLSTSLTFWYAEMMTVNLMWEMIFGNNEIFCLHCLSVYVHSCLWCCCVFYGMTLTEFIKNKVKNVLNRCSRTLMTKGKFAPTFYLSHHPMGLN